MMTDELKAAFERYKNNRHDDEYTGLLQCENDARLLADAYVELMARRESSLEQGELHAPTRAWFEWLIAQLNDKSSIALKSHELMSLADDTADLAIMSLQESNSLRDVARSLEGWKSQFESCGAFDIQSPIIDETITLDPAHADLRGEYHDVSLLLASADELKPRQELEFGKRYRLRVELVEE